MGKKQKNPDKIQPLIKQNPVPFERELDYDEIDYYRVNEKNCIWYEFCLLRACIGNWTSFICLYCDFFK